MAHENRLANARVVVFGGTSGIGFATASLCLSQGAIVTISGSNQPKIDKTLERLRTAYPNIPASNVQGFPVDLADAPNVEKSLTAFFERVTSGGKEKVNHIAVTSGDALKHPKISEVTIEDIYNKSNVRINGVVMIGKLLSSGKYMDFSASSSFTITGGVNSTKPLPGWFLVAGWGAFKEGLMRAMALDLKPIRVNLVAPGAIKTELFDSLPVEQVDKFVNAMADKTLVGKVGAPSDTAELYAYLMKDRFVTGGIFETNGGALLL